MAQVFQLSTDRWLRVFFLVFFLITAGVIAVAVPGMQSARFVWRNQPIYAGLTNA